MQYLCPHFQILSIIIFSHILYVYVIFGLNIGLNILYGQLLIHLIRNNIKTFFLCLQWHISWVAKLLTVVTKYLKASANNKISERKFLMDVPRISRVTTRFGIFEVIQVTRVTPKMPYCVPTHNTSTK